MTDLGLGEVSPEIPIELVSFFKQQIVSFYEQVFSTAMSSRSF